MRWKKAVWTTLKWTLLIVFTIVLVSVLVVVFDHYNWSTGFDKTLWDWIELLIIPAVLATAARWVNMKTRQQDRAIADERNQEMALQTY